MKHTIPSLTTVLTPSKQTPDFLGLQSEMTGKQHFKLNLGFDINVIPLGKGNYLTSYS